MLAIVKKNERTNAHTHTQARHGGNTDNQTNVVITVIRLFRWFLKYIVPLPPPSWLCRQKTERKRKETSERHQLVFNPLFLLFLLWLSLLLLPWLSTLTLSMSVCVSVCVSIFLLSLFFRLLDSSSSSSDSVASIKLTCPRGKRPNRPVRNFVHKPRSLFTLFLYCGVFYFRFVYFVVWILVLLFPPIFKYPFKDIWNCRAIYYSRLFRPCILCRCLFGYGIVFLFDSIGFFSFL